MRKPTEAQLNPDGLERTVSIGPVGNEGKYAYHRRALLRYQELHGHMLVPYRFYVPWSVEWPQEFWGLGQRPKPARPTGKQRLGPTAQSATAAVTAPAGTVSPTATLRRPRGPLAYRATTLWTHPTADPPGRAAVSPSAARQPCPRRHLAWPRAPHRRVLALRARCRRARRKATRRRGTSGWRSSRGDAPRAPPRQRRVRRPVERQCLRRTPPSRSPRRWRQRTRGRQGRSVQRCWAAAPAAAATAPGLHPAFRISRHLLPHFPYPHPHQQFPPQP